MSALDELQPTKKQLVMNLLREAGVDVSNWKDYKGGERKAAANPKYCYNWSFISPRKFVVLCLWIKDIQIDGDKIFHAKNFRLRGGVGAGRSAAVWAHRAKASDDDVQIAYREQLPVRVIVLEGAQRNTEVVEATKSRVKKRILDEKKWAVTEYDYATGECLLVRGAKPPLPEIEQADAEASGYEGKERLAFIRHRHRENQIRKQKLAEALRVNHGRLICEVPKCGFDFEARYGLTGVGYAQVHHLKPLSTSPREGRIVKMNELAVVCANCHVMIHSGGECRPLEGLIP